MRIKLPSKNPLRKWILAAAGLLPLFIVTIIAAIGGGNLLPIIALLLGSELGVTLVVILLAITTPFMPRQVGTICYEYLEFTDSYVILIHKDPVLSRSLPYDQTDLSLTFFTEVNPRHKRGYILHLVLSFTQTETFSVELTGCWFPDARFVRRLLDNTKRFKHFEFMVAPNQKEIGEQAEKSANDIRQQFQGYLTQGHMPPVGAILFHLRWIDLVVGIYLLAIASVLIVTGGNPGTIATLCFFGIAFINATVLLSWFAS